MANPKEEIALLAKYCGLPNFDSVHFTTKEGQKITGLITICQYLVRNMAPKNFLMGKTLEQEAFVNQWLEYRISHLDYCTEKMDQQNAFKKLNSHLEDKVYFVGNRITLADILMYFGLHSLYATLTFQEKEMYNHLSRWFNLIQHEIGVKNGLKNIPFSKTLLYATHDLRHL